MKRFVRYAAIVGALAISSSASAHIELTAPPAREVNQKKGPCGVVGSVRGDKVTVAQSGTTLHVEWRETVDHPSHFRISFDDDGDDAFVDPRGYDDRFTNKAVLIDGISDEAGGVFSADVMLPDIACDHCTLQLIQVMHDKAPYEVGTNDIYYRCIDLTLKKGPLETPTDGGTPPAGADGGPPSDPEPTDDDAGRTSETPGTDGAISDGEKRHGCDVAPGTPTMHAAWLLALLVINVFAVRHRIRRERAALAVSAEAVLASRRDPQGTRTDP